MGVMADKDIALMVSLKVKKSTLTDGLFGLSVLRKELEDRGHKGDCTVICDILDDCYTHFENGRKRFFSLDEAIQGVRELHDNWILEEGIPCTMDAGFKVFIPTHGNDTLKAWLEANMDELRANFTESSLTDVCDTSYTSVHSSVSEALSSLEVLYYGTLLKYGPGCASVTINVALPSSLYPHMGEDEYLSLCMEKEEEEESSDLSA